MRTFDPVRSRLENLVNEGSFSAQQLLQTKDEEKVLCVITLPYDEGGADALNLLKKVQSVVRKTDYVRSAFGAVQVVGWTSKEGAHAFLHKIQGVAKKRDIYCTTIRNGAELIDDSEVARIALGLEPVKDNAYLSNQLLSKEGIEEYAGIMRSLHPRVLERLKVVIAKSSERYDRLDWTSTPNGAGFITYAGPACEGELNLHNKAEAFSVGLEHDGEQVRYDAEKMMLIRESTHKGYKDK